ncbi:MAG: hypothetical protein AAGI53_10550 [Planctomycetota bacterium]
MFGVGEVFAQDGEDVLDVEVASGAFELRVVRVGPGGLARRGGWTGVLVEARDRGLQQREIVLRVSVEDRDGDDAHFDRVVASNPGFDQSFWVYARLPSSGGSLTLSAYSATETVVDPNAPEGLRGFDAGALLTRTPVDLSRAVVSGEGMYAVVGPNDFGLRQYSAGSGQSGPRENASPAGHEPTRVATGLAAQELPDRWQGLEPIEVLAWGSDELPSGLTGDQARALREWVLRGGHLVVVLGATDGVWLSEVDNPIHDMMPVIAPPLRREGVDLSLYQGLLTIQPSRDLPDSAVVRSFRHADDAGAYDAIPILEGPGGDVVVIRRLLGSGAVTLVGLDLAMPALRSTGLPEAEAFWHRVLGRRGPVVSGATELAQRFGDDAARAANRRDPSIFDADIDEQVDTSRRAAAGVLLGFIVFGAYWLIAGPVGFRVLRRYGMSRHAWVGFGASAVVFTAIGWGGATAIRPSTIEVQHLTFLEQVHGQPIQRGKSWGSVLVPWYGEARIDVGGTGSALAESFDIRRWHNLLAPWSPIGDSAFVGGFPDNRAYRIESRAPSLASVPARSTVKQFRFDWAGSNWAMPALAGLPGQVDAPVLVWHNGTAIDGALRHNLPGVLEDIVLIWSRGQTPVGSGGSERAISSQIFTSKLVFENPDDPGWEPGERLDLLAATANGEPATKYLGDLLTTGRRLGGAGGLAMGDIDDRMMAISLFNLLPPPDLRADASSGRVPVLASRSEGHGWDLGRWFTQPCLIVVGHLIQQQDEAGPPVPITVDGRVPLASGRTVVRWIYPMPADPPGWFSE